MNSSARLKLGMLVLLLVGSTASHCRTGDGARDEVSAPRQGRGPSHEDAFAAGGLTKVSADDLKATVVTPHLEQAITPGTSVLWCATFQLAWNEACAALGQDIRLANEPVAVAVLNKKAVKRGDLDETSFVALAGRVGEGIFGKIDRALADTFGGAATPRLSRPARVASPRDIFAYAYLFKHLEFAVPFEDIEAPLHFGSEQGERVACFGIGSEKEAPFAMVEQVVVLDYVDAADFVIELRTKSKGDRLILAKVRPSETLAETIAAVSERAARPDPYALRGRPLLKVPKFNFDVRREYGEFIGRPLLTTAGAPTGDVILGAIQDIRYQMDEKGVRLRSEAHVSIGCSASPPEQAMVFDRPFLMMLKRTDAGNPYFAMWVDNAELLVKVE